MSIFLSPKLRELSNGMVGFHCPGCDEMHVVSISGNRRPVWGYNGNPDAPTFTPSILVQTGHFFQPNGKHCDKSGDPEWPCACTCCHSFVTDGRIHFLQDCTHALAGQTLDLPDFRDYR